MHVKLRLQLMQQKTLNTKIEGLRWPQQNSNQVSLRSGRFATVVCRHCRLPRYFAHHASASLLRPPGALGSAPNRCVLIVAERSDGCTARLQNKKKNHSQGVVFFLVVLTGLEPVVSLCSVRFAIVAERRCRLLHSFAHHASASLHRPQGALRLRAPSMCRKHINGTHWFRIP